MRLPRVRFTVWRMMVAVAIVAVDLAAINWVVNARSWDDHLGLGGGMRTHAWRDIFKYDESIVRVVENHETGKTISRTVTRPATPLGLCCVWWPAAAGGFLTLLALVIART